MARAPKRLAPLLLGHGRYRGNHSLFGAIATPGVEFVFLAVRTDPDSAQPACRNPRRDNLPEIGFIEVYAPGAISFRPFEMRGDILANLIAANANSRANGHEQLLPPRSKALD
jgi:hypothetical protein